MHAHAHMHTHAHMPHARTCEFAQLHLPHTPLYQPPIPPPPRRAPRQAGENLRLRVTGCEESDIAQGFVLSSVKDPVPVVSQFEAQLVILELLEHNPIFTVGYRRATGGMGHPPGRRGPRRLARRLSPLGPGSLPAWRWSPARLQQPDHTPGLPRRTWRARPHHRPHPLRPPRPHPQVCAAHPHRRGGVRGRQAGGRGGARGGAGPAGLESGATLVCVWGLSRPRPPLVALFPWCRLGAPSTPWCPLP
jgi:hypothetical protein